MKKTFHVTAFFIISFAAVLLFTGCNRFLEVFYPAWDTTQNNGTTYPHTLQVDLELDTKTLKEWDHSMYLVIAPCEEINGNWQINPAAVIKYEYLGQGFVSEQTSLQNGTYVVFAWYDVNDDGKPQYYTDDFNQQKDFITAADRFGNYFLQLGEDSPEDLYFSLGLSTGSTYLSSGIAETIDNYGRY